MRLPIAESMESRIFTRASANFNKGGLAVKYLRERERESNQIIGMTKKIAILFRCVVII